MSDLPSFKATAVDSAGNTLASTSVEVRRVIDNTTAIPLFSDAAGTSALTNPFNANGNGDFEFFTLPGVYQITLGAGNSPQVFRVELSETGIVSRNSRASLSDYLRPPNSMRLNDGTLLTDGQLTWSYLHGSTAIADMPNAVPHGRTKPDHFTENVDPGVTSMSAAITAAFAHADNVYFEDGAYLIDTTVRLSANRKSWNGQYGTTLQVRTPDGDPGIWLAHANPTTPGNNGPVNNEFRRIIFQRIGTETGATVRLTRTTNTDFFDCTWWGGDPALLQEATQNTELHNPRSSPTVAYPAPVEAMFKHTTWTYDPGGPDEDIVRGFSTRLFGGTITSKNDPAVSRYEQTFLVEASDVFVVDGTYWGGSDISLSLMPRDMAVGGVVLNRTHFDDGGSTFVGATKLKVDTSNSTNPNARIGTIQCSTSRFTSGSNQIAIDVNAVNASIGDVFVTGGVMIGAYEFLVRMRGTGNFTDTTMRVSNTLLQRWASTLAPTPVASHAFDLNGVGGVTLSSCGLDAGQVTDGSAVFRPRANGVGRVSMTNSSLLKFDEADGNNIILSNIASVDNLLIQMDNTWFDGDITQYARYLPPPRLAGDA